MNRGDIRTRILNALNDSPTSPQFWTTDEINTLIDDGAEVLAEEAGIIRRSALVPLMPAQTYYYTTGIDSRLMTPHRIWLTSLNRRLVAISMTELDMINRTWLQTAGTYPEYWFSVSWNLFGVYPAMSQGTEIMRVDYLAWPRAMQDDQDELESYTSDQDGLVLYAVYQGLLKRWDVAAANQIIGQLVDRIADSAARSGIWRVDARSFRQTQTVDEGYRTGIGR